MKPYLSVVAASRNDDHGGDPLHRTQIFINCFAQQCDLHKLPAELILVDWNPVPDRPGLASVLRLPPHSEYCTARVISVPTVLHNTIKYSDRLAFFQMIAKNVGIRRANGSFVLATNIDIIFSNELMAFLAGQALDTERLYRLDRYDIKVDLPINADVHEVLGKSWRNIIRTNRRANLDDVIDPIYGYDAHCRNCDPHIRKSKFSDKITLVKEHGIWQLRPHSTSPIEHLHTNACGDFTLLSKKAWEAIRGYPDFEAFSFNIDSMGLVMAHYHGFHETSLLPPCVIFHIEHGLGSGYTPEGEQKLFDRLRAKRILSPDWSVLNPWVARMRSEQKAIPFNREDWGLAGHALPEQPLGSVFSSSQADSFTASAPIERSVGSLHSEYDLDSATLFHEREVRQARDDQVSVIAPQAETAALVKETAPATAALVEPPIAAAHDFDPFDGVYDYEHDRYSVADHYASKQSLSRRPIVTWGPAAQVEYLTSCLGAQFDREFISGASLEGERFSAAQFKPCDALLITADPRQMIKDVHRYGLLFPRFNGSEIAIWVQSDDGVLNHQLRWLASVKLVRRLLGAAGWNVVIGSQSELR